MSIKRILILISLIAAASTFAVGQNVDVKKLEESLKSDLGWAPCKNEARFDAVKDLFRQHGATDADMKVDNFKNVQNLVLTKKGKSDETVVVGAHYDKVTDGCGVLDNWSGIAILTTLWETISKMDTQKTYVLVAFGEEETGLNGSAAMVKAIPKSDRSKYCGMVNLDSFGLGYMVVLDSASSSKMTKAATDLGTRLKTPVNILKVSGADADSSSFKKNDIPAITFSALSADWPKVMHTNSDVLKSVLVPSVRVGYLFTLEYLKDVDAAGCSAYR